jgi:hypothetical protein
MAVHLKVDETRHQISVGQRDVGWCGRRAPADAADDGLGNFDKPKAGNGVGALLSRQNARGGNQHRAAGATG